MRWFCKYRIHIALFLGSLSLRLIYVWFVFDEKQFGKVMPGKVDSIAMGFLKGVEHVYPTAWASFYIPLAYFYKALDWFGALDERLFYVAIANCFLGAAGVVVFFSLAKIIFPGKLKVPIILTGIFLCYYPSLYFNALVLSENLFIPLFLGSVYLAWSYNGKSLLNPAITGLLLGICTAIRPILFPFLPLFALWMLFRSREKIKLVGLRYLPLLLCSFLLVIALFSVTTSRIHKYNKYAIAENGGVNVAMTWCQPRKIRYYISGNNTRWFSPPVFWNKDRSTDIITDVPFHNQMHYYKMGFNCMLEHPERLVTNFRNLINIFHSRLYPNLIYSKWHYQAVNFWKIISVALFLGFLLYPIFFRRRREHWVFGFLLIFSLLAMAYLANPGEERYLVPYYFVLIIFGAPALYSCIERILNYFSIKKSTISAPDISAMLVIVIYLLSPKSSTNMVYKIEKPLVNELVVERSYHDAAYWLVNNQRENGSFEYAINTDTYERSKKDLTLRQLLTSQGLANAAKRFDDQKILAAHRKNLEYVFSLVKKGDGFSYIKNGNQNVILNDTPFAVMALIDSPFASEYKEQINQLAEFLLYMQKSDGSFHVVYPFEKEDNLNEKSKSRIESYASGEAALACVNVYRFNSDQRYLECARKAYDYYFPNIKKSFSLSYGSWHTIAYARLYEVDQQEKYQEAIAFMADNIMLHQNTGSKKKKVEGGFDRKSTWYTKAEAVFTEALGYSTRVHRKNLPNAAKKYEEANRLGIQNLRYFQFGIADHRSIAGGIKAERNKDYAYVDNVGHSLMVFEEYLSRK